LSSSTSADKYIINPKYKRSKSDRPRFAHQGSSTGKHRTFWKVCNALSAVPFMWCSLSSIYMVTMTSHQDFLWFTWSSLQVITH